MCDDWPLLSGSALAHSVRAVWESCALRSGRAFEDRRARLDSANFLTLRLAADRARWRAMLQSGEVPPSFRQPPAPAPPLPMSHPSMRPRRAAAARTNAAIDASLRVEAQTTRLGKMKKI